MNPRNTPTSDSDLRWPVRANVTSPVPGKVQVWCSVLRCSESRLAEWKNLLATDERERASRFCTEELRHRFIVSRVILRRILGGCLGVSPQTVQFVSDANNKPRLADKPGVEFNLAHTGDVMLLAVTRGIPVGVDVERIRSMNDSQAIARRFFTKREATWLQRVKAPELDQAFFRLWTRKEAVLKATGEGISSGLDSLELLNDDKSFRDTVIRETCDSAGTQWILSELDPVVGIVGALALPVSSSTFQLQLACLQVA